MNGFAVILGDMELNLDFEDMPNAIGEIWLKRHRDVMDWCNENLSPGWRRNIYSEYLGRTGQQSFKCRVVMVLDDNEDRILWNMRPVELHY